jgi:signal transduction histidine kinase
MRSQLAWGVALLAAVLAVWAIAGAALTRMSMTDVVDSFVVTNAVMGVSFPLCGLILATRRPGNPIGWLFLVDGLGHAITAASVPLAVAGLSAQWPVWSVRGITTVGVYAWPWSIGLFLPLALLLFPDGRPPGRNWRWLLWAAIVTAPLFTAAAAHDGTTVPGGPPSYLVPSAPDLVWILAEVRTLVLFVLCAVALFVRYRRGGERERRQLLWLILATMVAIGVLIPWGLFVTGPVLMLLAIPLIGASVTVAILRYQLLDIRLVISRTVAYLLLTGLVAAFYLALVALFDLLLRREAGLGTSVAATVLIAVGFNPVRVRLQRLVEQALYGDRADPVKAVSHISKQLVDAESGLGGVLEALRAALRLPFVALRGAEGEIHSAGVASQTLHTIPLSYHGDRIGELVVGARAGEQHLDPADRAVLELLAVPLAVALFATVVSHELQRSRERIVNAREEERRRLRRDLHDGLGPALTGVMLQADLAGKLVPVDQAQAIDLLAEIRRQAGTAVEEIRRVAYALRPPALDELGLFVALRQQIAQLGHRPDGPPMIIDADLPDLDRDLPAAVESAAYRITVEALTNALRHSSAQQVHLRIRLGRDLFIEVTDDGSPSDLPWQAGVGLHSMRERAAELGGTCLAGPTDSGGLVQARLPLEYA